MKMNNNMYIDDEKNAVMGKLAPSRKQMENYMNIANVVARECGIKDKNYMTKEENKGIKN